MHRKVWITTVLAILVLVVFAAVAHAKTYQVSHVRPQGTAIDKDLNWFAQEVDKATDGKFKVKIYPASSLGDYTVVQERISVGAVDMACQPPASPADRRFQVVYFPYMVKSWEQAQKNYSAGAPLRETVAELYAAQDIKVLAAWPVYFGGIALNTEPVAPGDPEVNKGIKLRVPPMKTFQMLADNTGYQGTPLPFSEAFTAVQTGVVDGVIGSGAEGYYSSFRDVTKYYIPANTHFEVWYLLINADTFDGLDEDVQKQVQDVAGKFEERRWQVAEEHQKADEKRLEDNGTVIVNLTPEEIESIAQKVHTTVWPAVLDDVGQEWGQGVLDSIVE
jgi:TRAP-type C4-dicarboxylate transport system substrate-binding protein